MIPMARTEKLLVQEVGEELIVYDEERGTAHCLTPMASRIWRYCDGQNTVEEMAKRLETELEITPEEGVDLQGLVWQTLEELESFHLIQGDLLQPTGISKISRRKALKTASLVGGVALGAMFPAVKSIVAPTPAMASSKPGKKKGKKKGKKNDKKNDKKNGKKKGKKNGKKWW